MSRSTWPAPAHEHPYLTCTPDRCQSSPRSHGSGSFPLQASLCCWGGTWESIGKSSALLHQNMEGESRFCLKWAVKIITALEGWWHRKSCVHVKCYFYFSMSRTAEVVQSPFLHLPGCPFVMFGNEKSPQRIWSFFPVCKRALMVLMSTCHKGHCCWL